MGQRFRQAPRRASSLSRWTPSARSGTTAEHGSPAGPAGASTGSREVRAGLCGVCVVTSPPRRPNCQHNCFLPSWTGAHDSRGVTESLETRKTKSHSLVARFQIFQRPRPSVPQGLCSCCSQRTNQWQLPPALQDKLAPLLGRRLLGYCCYLFPKVGPSCDTLSVNKLSTPGAGPGPGVRKMGLRRPFP